MGERRETKKNIGRGKERRKKEKKRKKEERKRKSRERGERKGKRKKKKKGSCKKRKVEQKKGRDSMANRKRRRISVMVSIRTDGELQYGIVSVRLLEQEEGKDVFGIVRWVSAIVTM